MQPFRNILCAADFSQSSKEAFRMACSLAVEKKTRVTVVHVVEPNWVAEEPVYFGQASVQFYDAGSSEATLESFERKLRDFYTPDRPLEVEYHTCEGEPAEELVRMARQAGSDLIAMGTHGRTGLRWLLAGSVATAVMRRAPCPVLALRTAEACVEAGQIGVILHPTDFSTESEAALHVARSLARDLGARLIILNVIPLELLSSETMTGPIDPLVFQSNLDDLRKQIDGADLKYPVETQLERGDPGAEIVRSAQANCSGLIVMGTHGRSGVGRFLMGSVAEFVLPRANCGVLVVNSKRRADAAPQNRPASRVTSAL